MFNRVGWRVCVVYATIPSFWLLVHPFAAFWRSRQRSPYRMLIPLWMAMWMMLGLITSPWRNESLYQESWVWVPAVLLLAAVPWIYWQSGANFSLAQLGGLPEMTSGSREQRLVVSGIRARIRHPIYLGHLCQMLAWSLGTGLVVCYALTGFAVISGAIMIRLEDRELERRFGEQYREYRRKVPTIVPRIWK